MASLVIGVIAEADSDVRVVEQVLCKRLSANRFTIKPFRGGGSAKLRRKCLAWATDLFRRGCSHLLVVHDLDTADLKKLRSHLEATIAGSPFASDSQLVVIPIIEIEAWLLADPAAIARVCKLPSTPRVRRNTERIDDPKKYLRRLVQRHGGRCVYTSTVHNAKIAGECRQSELRRCNSYRVLDDFVRTRLLPSG